MSITLLSGDCRDVLPTLAANSVHMVCTSPPYYALRSYLEAAHPDKHREIGSESTPDEYLTTMVAVFREVRRVLRPDGTLFLNIGDSYAGGAGGRGDRDSEIGRSDGTTGKPSQKHDGIRLPRPCGNAKPKDLLLMPARLALALQADGWWVRSDIIWAKPNPMPESCTDRPTSAHEHVFLLTRSPRYFYDAEAVREEAEAFGRAPNRERLSEKNRDSVATGVRNGVPGDTFDVGTRNLRNVWTIATHAFSAAHFATYPPELVERCIRAGTSERGCCSACGAPWRRTTDTSYERNRHGHSGRTDASGSNGWDGSAYPNLRKLTTTTGWSASCACAADVVPATVLDPFAGAGTTLLVADRLQRNAIGVELNAAYTEMAMERVRADAPLFVATPEPQPVPGFAQADLFAEAAD